eukprot:TRINITY_DN89306_c0_g1_i1.p1 TRINITY_DN89306_c0_g1~~TRINITY_DN89306_c0_g1_i1.p1  ORF type:complete len:164 (-),score=25.72 TRINITY_DN89306_c0_g1_i1:92-529(-)
MASSSWTASVGHVRRLENLLLEGLEQGFLTSRSETWRGRRSEGTPPALMAPDWRKKGVWENDWAELLLASFFWRSSAKDLQELLGKLQLSQAMIDNVAKLQALARQPLITVQSAPPAVHILKAAVASGESPKEFWRRWPLPPEPQ